MVQVEEEILVKKGILERFWRRLLIGLCEGIFLIIQSMPLNIVPRQPMG